MNMKLIPYKKVKASLVGLEFSPDLTFEEWSAIGKYLQVMGGAIHWFLGDWIRYGEANYGEKYAQAIEETGYDYGTLRNDVYVCEQIDLSRRRDNVSFSAHKEVAMLDPDEQDKILEKAQDESLTCKDIHQLVCHRKVTNKVLPLPKGLYDTIYADPPWCYEHCEPTREVENKYPTMELEDIQKLNPPIAKNAILFLWATAPKVEEAISVLNAWGFVYRTCAIWDKEIIGMGYWFRGQHELLLVGVKGNISTPEPSVRISSVYQEKRTKHSKKPDYYYEVIEKYFPNGKYLELFARNTRKNWESWGNEL